MKPLPTASGITIKHATFKTLPEALDYAAQGATGFSFFGPRGKLLAVLPYRQLREEALILARKLASLSFPRGTTIAILAHTHPFFVKLFFACQYAGYVPVPLPLMLQLSSSEAYVAQLVRLLKISRARAFFTPPEFLKFARDAAEKAGVEISGAEEDLVSLPEKGVDLTPLQEDELAYIQFTSGSTRFPRGVMVTQRALMHNLHLISKFGVCRREGDRAVSWLPFYHDMGLVGLVLAPLASQVSVDFFSPKDFIMRPGFWLKLISEHRATISFSPPFGYELATLRLKEEDLEGLDLSSWRVAGVGAEMIRPSVLEKFARKFAPCGFNPKAFLPCYGMAECTLAISFTPLGKGARVDAVEREPLAKEGKVIFSEPSSEAKLLVRCGKPLPGLEIEIRDERGNSLPEKRVGLLFVRGESIMAGYLGDPETTEEVLKEGWLNTGDLAYLNEGEIVITGRAKDMIIVHGKNIWPQDIEALAESLPEVRAGNACAFPVPDEEGRDVPVVVVQTKALSSTKERELKAHIASLVRKELGIDCQVVLVPRNTIVRTTSGKPARSHTRRICQEKGYLPFYFSSKEKARVSAS